MKNILTSKQMKVCDNETISGGVPSAVLMERAAKAVFDIIIKECDTAKTLIVCGSGNNGGDGILVAELLYDSGYDCDILYVGKGHTMSDETKKRYYKAIKKGIPFTDEPQISEYSLVVDAVLGTGLCFKPEGLVKEAINRINDSEACIVSVDIPSGISSDTGRAMGLAVNADITVAIQSYKRGHILSDGVDASGKVYCSDIGIDTTPAYEIEEFTPLAVERSDLSLIPRRKKSSHKGTFGRVLVIAGNVGMCGAAYLSASASYRSGAGLVEIFTPRENREILQTLLPEAIVTVYDRSYLDRDLLQTSVDRANVIIIGPGMGTDECSTRILKEVYQKSNAPLIIDADALNITGKEKLSFPTEVPVIVTPHPAEFSRLTGKTIREISDYPIESAVNFANENDIICVLKFAKTVITDGSNIFVNMSGGPALSKGGSGDVLTGVIAGMLCSGLSPVGAASLGAYIHGSAGDIASECFGEMSPVARDVIDAIPSVLKDVKGKK